MKLSWVNGLMVEEEFSVSSSSESEFNVIMAVIAAELRRSYFDAFWPASSRKENRKRGVCRVLMRNVQKCLHFSFLQLTERSSPSTSDDVQEVHALLYIAAWIERPRSPLNYDVGHIARKSIGAVLEDGPVYNINR